MSGLDLLKEIRCGAPGVSRDIPFAMLTGFSDTEVVAAAFRLDVDAFLVKPVSSDEMAARIGRILQQDRILRAPSVYREVNLDIDTTSGDAAVEAATPGAGVTFVEVDKLAPGDVLASDLRTSGGQTVLKKGRQLNDLQIARLRDITGLDQNLQRVWIRR